MRFVGPLKVPRFVSGPLALTPAALWQMFKVNMILQHLMTVLGAQLFRYKGVLVRGTQARSSMATVNKRTRHATHTPAEHCRHGTKVCVSGRAHDVERDVQVPKSGCHCRRHLTLLLLCSDEWPAGERENRACFIGRKLDRDWVRRAARRGRRPRRDAAAFCRSSTRFATPFTMARRCASR